MKLLPAAVLLVTCLLPFASAVILRFNIIDFSLGETEVTGIVTVEKTDANTGDIDFNVRVLTVSEFLLMKGQFPPGLENTTTEFDPAEPEDFDGTTLMGSFAANPDPGSIDFILNVTNDAINEATEVYTLHIEITASSDNVTLENGGVSRVLILDNDAITIGFARLTYSVQESVGTLDTLVFIQKEGGVVTEQVITVFVQCVDGSPMFLPFRPFLSPPAVNGQDYTCAGGDTIELTFLPSDQVFAVTGISILDDLVAEVAVENFQLQITVPLSGSFSAGSPANVLIRDNESLFLRFTQIDYYLRETEGTGLVTVLKSTANTGNIEFVVHVLTVSEFLLMVGRFPPGLENTMTEFDPAEPADFDGTTLMGSFAASPVGGSMSFNLNVTNDAINEATEVYILHIEITASSDNVTLENEGVSRVLILDNDGITIAFAQPTYSVQETIGTLDTLVFIQKEGGVMTEQVINVIVQCDVGSVMVLPDPPRPFLSRPAISGQDYTCSGGRFFDLTFQPSDQMLAITGISILDDLVAEVAVENFELRIFVTSIGNFSDGLPAPVFILDNEFAILGFEQTTYTFLETAGTVQVCFIINEGQFPVGYVFAALFSEDDTATAPNDYTSVFQLPVVLPAFDPPSIVRRHCQTITIKDDAVCENNETFTLMLRGIIIFPNVMLDPTRATITIDDNKALTVILKFTEVDISLGEKEVTGIVTVEKTDANMGNIEFLVRVLTVSEFLLVVGQFPPGLENTTTEFDPAELEDFDGTTLMGSFAASPVPGRIDFDLNVTNDAINEATEVYILHIEITASSDNVTLENGGVSRVLILDNDAITIGFAQPTYSVQETVGTLDTLVFVQKEGGVVTEQVITVFIQCVDGSVMVLSPPATLLSPAAMNGQDYTCTGGGKIELTFLPSDQVFAITGISILDDLVAEVAVENFQLQINVSSTGGFLGGSTANVFIMDNEFAILGFEQTTYTFLETAGAVQVCFIINDGEFPPGYAFANFDSADDSATAPEDYTLGVRLIFTLPSFIPPPTDQRRCETITIVDDTVCENNETFTLMLTDPGFNPPNVILDPAMATITIKDNEDCNRFCSTETDGVTVRVECPGSETIPGIDGFLCSLDGGNSFGCIPPFSISALSEGPHTIEVVARRTDENGTVAVGQSEFVIDGLDLYFINDTPQVNGTGILHAQFRTNRPGSNVVLTCRLIGRNGREVDDIQFESTQDCGSGSVTYSSLPIGDYVFRVIARDTANDNRAVIRSGLWILGNNDFCSITAINRRVTVFGNSATIEFGNTGAPTGFLCRLDRQPYSPCSSPVTVTNENSGGHRLTIRPAGCGQPGIGHRRISIYFEI